MGLIVHCSPDSLSVNSAQPQTFHWPQSAGEPGTKIRLAPQALQLLLDGVDLKAGARRAWYEAA